MSFEGALHCTAISFAPMASTKGTGMSTGSPSLVLKVTVSLSPQPRTLHACTWKTYEVKGRRDEATHVNDVVFMEGVMEQSCVVAARKRVVLTMTPLGTRGRAQERVREDASEEESNGGDRPVGVSSRVFTVITALDEEPKSVTVVEV